VPLRLLAGHSVKPVNTVFWHVIALNQTAYTPTPLET
jgi:hypothetical protein